MIVLDIDMQKDRMIYSADHMIDELRRFMADTNMLPDYRALLERHVLEIQDLQQRCMDDIGMRR